MYIKEALFENYRNLDGLMIEFPTDVSFIIGENGIGKSNILNALTKIFVYGRFVDADFYDANKPIQVTLRLYLSDYEIGSFGEYIDPDDKNIITLIVEQEYDSNSFKLIHAATEEEISSKLLKNVVYIYYDSLRNPKAELSFDKEKGSGSFLNYMIKYFLGKSDEEDEAYVNKSKLGDILNFINENISELKAIKRNDITVSINPDNINFLNSIFQLYDKNKVELKKSGYGIQFSLLVVISLFERIIEITEKAKKQEQAIENLNCILAFDEPEIHLHPFAQRALIKDLSYIASGKDEGFNKIIKSFFNISSFNAQLLIVSHSDRIITGEYENIVRLYNDNTGKTCAVSGQTIKNSNAKQLMKYEKHLQKQFPYFCEALFARKVIFVEGESEFGAIPKFFDKLGVDLDNKGIAIINTLGGGAINPLINIFSLFKIDCLGIKDRDVYEREKSNGTNTDEDDKLIEEQKLILTRELNFEYEIVNSFSEFQELYDILYLIDKSFVLPQQKKKVNDFIEKFKFDVEKMEEDLKWEDCTDNTLKKLFLLVSLTGIKNITTGALLAESLDIKHIPQTYREIIMKLAI